MPDYTPPSIPNTGPAHELPPGFPFEADSAIRRFAEPAGFFLLPSIATQTVMHDKVAAGVDEHSAFLQHPWGRLIHVADAALTLVFSDAEAAQEKAEQLWTYHHTVQGVRGELSYSANDAELQTWVLGCVFRGIEEANRRWAKPLQPADRRNLWQDTRTFGLLFGIPERVMPRDIDAIDEYWHDMLESNQLVQTAISCDLVHRIFSYHSWKAPLPLARFGQAVSKASIEPALLARAGVEMTRNERRISHAADWLMQHSYSRIPKARREQVIPMYLNTRRKMHAAKKAILPSRSVAGANTN